MKTKIVGENSIAKVYKSKGERGYFESVISKPNKKKIVYILSTLYGCPAKCVFCDASLDYKGIISTDELIKQLEMLISKTDKSDLNRNIKIQFSRMGDPAFNRHVIDAMEKILHKYRNLKPVLSLSTIGPRHCDRFFLELGNLLDLYGKKNIFQIQFSIHSTDPAARKEIIPIDTLSMDDLGIIGSIYSELIGRKITLNFAVHKKSVIEPKGLRKYFNSKNFIIKLTPVNPTYTAKKHSIETCNSIEEWNKLRFFAKRFSDAGYEIIESVGDFRENIVMSNCGQYIRKHH